MQSLSILSLMQCLVIVSLCSYNVGFYFIRISLNIDRNTHRRLFFLFIFTTVILFIILFILQKVKQNIGQIEHPATLILTLASQRQFVESRVRQSVGISNRHHNKRSKSVFGFFLQDRFCLYFVLYHLYIYGINFY